MTTRISTNCPECQFESLKHSRACSKFVEPTWSTTLIPEREIKEDETPYEQGMRLGLDIGTTIGKRNLIKEVRDLSTKIEGGGNARRLIYGWLDQKLKEENYSLNDTHGDKPKN